MQFLLNKASEFVAAPQHCASVPGAGAGKVAPAGLVGTPDAGSIVLMLDVTGRIAWAAEVRMSASRPWVALP
jgi:hypothetical protein